jgi:hypothetical protein
MHVIQCWRRLGRRSALAIAATLSTILVLASCTSATSGQGPADAARSARVISLTKISTLKALFNRDVGHPRLLLVFSPT